MLTKKEIAKKHGLSVCAVVQIIHKENIHLMGRRGKEGLYGELQFAKAFFKRNETNNENISKSAVAKKATFSGLVSMRQVIAETGYSRSQCYKIFKAMDVRPFSIEKKKTRPESLFKAKSVLAALAKWNPKKKSEYFGKVVKNGK